MSRNPFRKARDYQEEIIASTDGTAVGLFDAFSEEAPVKPKPTKTKKKVVIKTPPRSPEEQQRRFSQGLNSSPKLQPQYGGTEETRTVARREDQIQHSDGLDGMVYNGSPMSRTSPEVDGIHNGGSMSRTSPGVDGTYNGGLTSNVGPAVVQAPYNPFARTLATAEDKHFQQERHNSPEHRTKPTFDVDMFKDILLNGAAPPSIPVRQEFESKQASKGTSTSTAETSDFETRYPSLSTTVEPQTTENVIVSDDDDTSSDEFEKRSVITPQVVPFDDFDTPAPATVDGLTAPSATAPALADKSDIDQEKTLPTLPMYASQKVLPPPPPATRRQAQASNMESRRRSSSVMSKSSLQSDASTAISNDTTRAPPPPPTRRSRTIDTEAAVSPGLDKASMVPPPAPAPRRAPSKAQRQEKRPSSARSHSSLQALNEGPSPPPRPPPRRAGDSNRSSMDGHLPVVKQDSRRTSNDIDAATTPNNSDSKPDLLSDLAALQREVDELRARAIG